MSHNVDYDWLSRKSKDFQEYAGLYVVIVGREIVATAKTAEEAYQEAKKIGVKGNPAIGYVRKGDGGLHILTAQAGG